MTPKIKWLAREVLLVFTRENGIADPGEIISGLAAALAVVACKLTPRGSMNRMVFFHEFHAAYEVFVQERDREDVFGVPATERGMVHVGRLDASSADDLPDVVRLDARSKRLLSLAVRGATEGERIAASLAFVRRIAR